MSSNENQYTNAAYVASWKKRNPKFQDLKIENNILELNGEKISLDDIYMQDILMNTKLFNEMEIIDSTDLFNIIKIHATSIKIKEKMLQEKIRRLNEYES